MLRGSMEVQPVTRLFRSWVPAEAFQIHPPASLVPTTIPLSLTHPCINSANVAPVGSGIVMLPEVVPINAWELLPFPVQMAPTTWPESLTAQTSTSAPLHPAGNGINVLPEGVPINACEEFPL